MTPSLCPEAAGITLVGLAVWVKVGSTSFVRVMGSSFIYFAHTWDFGIAAGCLIIVLGLLGCWSAYKENRCLLMMVRAPQGGLYWLGFIVAQALNPGLYNCQG